MAKTYEEYLEEAKKTTAAEESAAIKVVDDSALAAKTATQEYYDKQIGNTNTAYESEYQKNAVQKLINEKQIAEKTANLGLTDSGLNRTQQTAAQLSYANQKGKIDLAKQSALDELSLSLSSALSNIEQEAQANKSSIKQTYAQQNAATAAELYNTDVENEYNTYLAQLEADTELQKAQIEAAADVQKAAISASASSSSSDSGNDKLLWIYTGAEDDNGNLIFRNSEGKTQAFAKGVNPYTGTRHRDAKYGTFSNGYQPNNIEGTKLKNSSMQTNITGKPQTVWYTEEKDETGKIITKYWLWRGNFNRYDEVDISELGL